MAGGSQTKGEVKSRGESDAIAGKNLKKKKRMLPLRIVERL